MKKKKKKQVVLDVEEPSPVAAESRSSPAPSPAPETEVTPPAPVAAPVPAEVEADSGAATPVNGDDKPSAEDMEMFSDMKKKKKKKKEIPLDLEASTELAPATTMDGLDVPIKKKKSRKQASDFAKELDELEAENEDEAEGDLDGDVGEDGEVNGEVVAGKEAWVLEGREATYPELLKRFYSQLHQHNPELAGEKKRYTIVPPQVAREGTKKTVFVNVMDICRRMHRGPEHVIQFLYAELGTTGSVDGTQRLVMKGRYTQKQIENVLRKYIVEYVTCKICKSPDTLLGKENRLYFMTCETCGSRLSVSAIKTGFQAQIGKRIKPV